MHVSTVYTVYTQFMLSTVKGLLIKAALTTV